jgi:hypothetical protein
MNTVPRKAQGDFRLCLSCRKSITVAMQNGVYRVIFVGPLTQGRGVLIARNGHLCGGDSGYVYSGNYTSEGTNGLASIQVKRDDPDSTSVFGNLSDFTLNISFSVTASGFTASGTIPGYPQAKIEANAVKIADA